VDDGFESRLIDSLQPIRGFAIAQGIYHLFASGMFDRLNEGPASVEDVATSVGTDPGRTLGLLRFLANEGVLAFQNGKVILAAKARDLHEFRPWYELFIGGYAKTFLQLTDALRDNTYADRDGVLVNIGICGISRYGALPLVRSLVRDLLWSPAEIIDLRCGDGEFLMDFAQDYPDALAVGVDPNAPVEEGSGTLFFRRASAVDYVRSLTADRGPDRSWSGTPPRLFLAAFLLREVLEQQGREAVVQMVWAAVRKGSYLVVVEVDHRPADPSVMRHGLGLAYYNPYFLLHVLTEQRLEPVQFWFDLFDEAGAAVVSHRVASHQVDSTGLEFGCLLTRKESGGK
jgi:2-ketoarginine methyltransferase